MSMRDHYRTRAAEFQARARSESNEMSRREYESLANIRAWLREPTATTIKPVHELPLSKIGHGPI
jgi:hypothetical protein